MSEDRNPWLSEIEAARNAAQQQQDQPAPVVGGLTPPAPSLPDYQAEIAAARAAPQAISKEPFGPPAPVAPYGPAAAMQHGFTPFGLDEPIRGAGAATIRYLQGQGFHYPEAVAEVGRGREAYAAEHPVASLGYNLAGAVVNPINRLGMGPISEATTVPRQAAISGTIGGLTGGIQGAAENTTSLEDMARGSAIGTTLGAATGTAIPAVGGALFPPLKPGVGALRNVDVVPMPGQAVGGPLGAAESFFSHIPIIGAPVKAALGEVRDKTATAIAAEKGGVDFVRGAVNQPLAHIGETVNPSAVTGNAMVFDMKGKISKAYNDAVPTAGGIFDNTAQTAITDALANAKLKLRPQEAAEFERFVQDNIVGKIGTSGKLSGPDFRTIDQALGEDAHNLFTRGGPFEVKLGKEYDNLQDTMRDWLQRVSPTNATDLQNANLAFRTAKPILYAARSTKDPEGYFTTAHLRSGARSASPAQFEVGKAPMQDFANNADLQARDLTKASAEVLGKPPGLAGTVADVAGYTIPTTGGITAALLHPEGLSLFNPLNHPYLAAIAPALYGIAKGYSSEPGRKFVTGLFGKLGEAQQAIAPYGPSAGQVAPGLLTGLYNRQTQP